MKDMNQLGIRETMKDVMFKMDMDLRPFFNGVTGPKSKDRETVLSKIRRAIKDVNHIDALTIEGS